MSTNQDQTVYYLQINGSGDGATSMSEFAIVQGPSFGDQEFLAFVAAALAALPASWQMTVASGAVQAFKQENNVTTWNANLSANPPVLQ